MCARPPLRVARRPPARYLDFRKMRSVIKFLRSGVNFNHAVFLLGACWLLKNWLLESRSWRRVWLLAVVGDDTFIRHIRNHALCRLPDVKRSKYMSGSWHLCQLSLLNQNVRRTTELKMNVQWLVLGIMSVRKQYPIFGIERHGSLPHLIYGPQNRLTTRWIRRREKPLVIRRIRNHSFGGSC